MAINLTAYERNKFAAWLEQESATDDELVKQLEKLPCNLMFAKRMKQGVIASIMISQKLRGVEEVTIGNGPADEHESAGSSCSKCKKTVADALAYMTDIQRHVQAMDWAGNTISPTLTVALLGLQESLRQAEEDTRGN